MPDAPISTTPNLGLGQWASGADPGAEALNENWALIDAAAMSHGADFPVTYPVGGLFLNSADQAIYRNDGTELIPVWVNILPVGDINDLAVLKDGSVPMEADFDLGGFKGKNAAAAENPDELVVLAQLEAAIEAGLGSLAGSYAYCLARNTGDLTDTSPVLFEADENDPSCSGATMHDEDTDNSEFVAPQDGFYMLVARMRVADGGGGSVKWLVNGVEAPACVYPQVMHDVGENECFLQDVMMIALDAGDVVTLGVYGLISEPLTIKADSTVAMFLLASNAVGGGDLKADGTIPMTAPFDNGAQRSTNAGDSVEDDDLITQGQVGVVADDLQSQINNLATEVDAISGSELKAPEVEVTSGVFAFTGSWVELASSRLDFTLAGTRRVIMEAEGTALPNFINQCDVQLGIRVQLMVADNPSGSPADYYGTYGSLGPYGYGMIVPVTCKKRVTLAAGDWRISIIGRKPNGAANSSALSLTAAIPARIGCTYLE